MFPWIYEFRWEIIHLAFLGAFFAVVTLLAFFVAVAGRRALADLRCGRAEALRWREDFHDLPAGARTCRHALTGEVALRSCDNGFDCRTCARHLPLLQLQAQDAAPAAGRTGEASRSGPEAPPDRLYHRGHTWVRREEDGTVTVGLDDLAGRLFGTPGEVRFPPPGSPVVVNGTAWRMRRDDAEIRVLSPVDGTVVATGGADRGWYLRVRPSGGDGHMRHLLRGGEVDAWLASELERLQRSCGNGRPGPTLANGGQPVEDLWGAIPERRRDAVLGELLLDP